MAYKCAHCGSAKTEALADRYLCFVCAGHTGYDGTALSKTVTDPIVPTNRDVEPGRPVPHVTRLAHSGVNHPGEVGDEFTTTASVSTSLGSKTKEELYEMAQERDIAGRSTMDKDELVDALSDED